MSRLPPALLFAALALAALPLRAQVSLRPSQEFAIIPQQHNYVIGLESLELFPGQGQRLYLFTTQESYSSFLPYNPQQGWQKEFDITPFNVNLFDASLVAPSPIQFSSELHRSTYFFTGGLSLNRSIRFQQGPIRVISNDRIANFSSGQMPSGFVLRNPTSSGAPVNVFYTIDGEYGTTPAIYRHGDVTTPWTDTTPFGTSGPGQVTSGVGALRFGPDGMLNVLDTGGQRIIRYNPDTLAYVGEVALGNTNTNRGTFIITPNGYIMTTFTDSAGGAIYDYTTGSMLGTYGTYSAADLHVGTGFGGKTSMTQDPVTGLVYVLSFNPDGSDGVFVYDPSRLLDPAFTDPTRLVVSHYRLTHISGSSGTNEVLAHNDAEFTIMGDNNYPSGIFFQEGTLILGSTGALGTTGTISFSGGTMKFSAANTTDYSARFSTGAGQKYSLDTNGQNVAVGTALTSTGGSLTKSGAGTLTLNGANTFTGGTTISGGTLALGTGASLASSTITVGTGAVFDVSAEGFTLASGQTLRGAGTIAGSFTVDAGAHLAPGNSPGTLTFTTGLTLVAGSILDFELGTASDLIRVTGGTLSGPLSGLVTLNLSNSGGFTAGTYTLFDFTSAATSSFDVTDFTFGTTLPGYTYALAFAGSTLALTATASAIPEPSTYAALLGALALGLAILRRRRAL